MNRYQGAGEIILKDAVGAVKGAVELGIDDEIITADIPGSAGAGLDETSLLPGEKKELLSLLDRILPHFQLIDEQMGIIDGLFGNRTCVVYDSLGQRRMEAVFMDVDFLGQIT
jgi:hypothetical protein